MNIPRSTRSSTLAAAIVGTALVLAGCAEKPQTASRKADTQAWETPANGFAAQGYKAGDQAAWEEQMRKRSLGQNEYSRTVAPP